MRNIEGRMFSGILLASIAGFVALALGFSSIARIASLTVGVVGLCLATAQFVASVRHKKTAESSYEGSAKSVATVWVWLAGYIVVLWLVGFYYGTFLFIAGFGRWYSRYSWRYSIGFALAVTFLAYGLFHVA